MFILASFLLTSKNIVEISLIENSYRDYTYFFQLFKLGEIIPLKSFKFISVIPKKVSNIMYSRSSNGHVQTDFFYSVCFLNQNFKAKKEVVLFKSKEEATNKALEISQKVLIEFVEYNPKKVRDIYLQRNKK